MGFKLVNFFLNASISSRHRVSILLKIYIWDCRAHICLRVSSTIDIFSSYHGSHASMTCRRISLSIESSRVDVKAAMRSGGRSRINPIVSLRRISIPWTSWYQELSSFPHRESESQSLPTLVPRVAKSLSSASTHLCVRVLNREDFPALVYPTIPTVFSHFRFRHSRCRARVLS